MASCASDRRSTLAELLADTDCLSGPGRSRTDRLRIASAVLSRTELQAQGPAAMAGSGYSITLGQASTRPNVQCGPHPKSNSISPGKEKGPHRAPADRVERIQSVSQELRGCEQRRSQRPTAACWAIREMKARVDCGNADPPCVSALLCRCSRAEHRIGARWWKKESNLLVPCGSPPRLRRVP